MRMKTLSRCQVPPGLGRRRRSLLAAPAPFKQNALDNKRGNGMASDIVSTRARAGFTLGPLWLQVLVAALLGVFVGVIWPHQAAATQELADGFVKLIRMLLAPVIFVTVVVGIARMGDLSEVGRVGIKAIVYFEVLSTISLIMGGVVADIFHPGAGMHIDPKTLN